MTTAISSSHPPSLHPSLHPSVPLSRSKNEPPFQNQTDFPIAGICSISLMHSISIRASGQITATPPGCARLGLGGPAGRLAGWLDGRTLHIFWLITFFFSPSFSPDDWLAAWWRTPPPSLPRLISCHRRCKPSSVALETVWVLLVAH